MDYRTVLDRIESLDGENSDLYLETVEQNLLVHHQSAGEKIQDAETDGFYTISIVKKRIVYRTFLESVRQSEDVEEFTTQVEEFYMEIRSENKSRTEELEHVFEEILANTLEEVK